MKIKVLLILALSLLLGIHCFSQKIIINGQESDGKLQWAHFTGKVDKSSSHNAFTYYKFNYKYQSAQFVGDSAIITGFVVTLEFDHKNSWAKKDKTTDYLLIHEQGHFNVGILCVREIMKKFKEAKFTKSNYNSLLQTIISDASKKYHEMGLTYDKETDHSKNTEQQEKWNNFFAGQL